MTRNLNESRRDGTSEPKRTETNSTEPNESECLDSYEYLPGWSLNKDIPVLPISLPLSLSVSVHLFPVQLRRRQSSSVDDDAVRGLDAFSMLYSVARAAAAASVRHSRSSNR